MHGLHEAFVLIIQLQSILELYGYKDMSIMIRPHHWDTVHHPNTWYEIFSPERWRLVDFKETVNGIETFEVFRPFERDMSVETINIKELLEDWDVIIGMVLD